MLAGPVPQRLEVLPFRAAEVVPLGRLQSRHRRRQQRGGGGGRGAGSRHHSAADELGVTDAVVEVGARLTLRWRVLPAGSSRSVRIELFQLTGSHSRFVSIVAKRATEGSFYWTVPAELQELTTLYLIFRSRRRQACKVMGVSQIFDVVSRDNEDQDQHEERDEDGDQDEDPETGADAAPTAEKSRHSKPRCHLRQPTLPATLASPQPVVDCSGDWQLLEADTRGTSAVCVHRSDSPSQVSSFRATTPVLSKGALCIGSYYFQRRLAYFEIEVLHLSRSVGAAAHISVGWANEAYPLRGVAVGADERSVGYRSSDGAMMSAEEAWDGGDAKSGEGGSVSGESKERAVLRTNSGRPIVREDGRTMRFAQEWADGDVVGCGLDCRSGDVFFTRNGNLLALPFSLGEELLLRGEDEDAETSENAGAVWPVVSAQGHVKIRFRMQRRLLFDGFAEVVRSLDQRSAARERGLRTTHQHHTWSRVPPPPNPATTAAAMAAACPAPRGGKDRQSPESAHSETEPPAAPGEPPLAAAAVAPIVNADDPRPAPSRLPSPATPTPSPSSSSEQQSTHCVSAWGVAEVLDWLNSFPQLARHAPAFEEIGVDGSMLLAVNDADLKEDLHVTVRLHRVKILNEVQRLALEENLLSRSSALVPAPAPPTTAAQDKGRHSSRSSLAVSSTGSSSAGHMSPFWQVGVKMPPPAAVWGQDAGLTFAQHGGSFSAESSSVPASSHMGSAHTMVSADSSGSGGVDGGGSGDSSGSNKSYAIEDATIVALFSSPLVDESKNPVPLLAHEHEQQIMCASLRKAGRAVRLRMSHASTDSLCAAITLGCRVLHYSGHADASSLSFEDGNGLLHRLDVDRLKDLFGRRIGTAAAVSGFGSAAAMLASTGRSDTGGIGTSCRGAPPKPSLVFVSACHSQAAGEAFLAAGAEHVVAVEREQAIEDRAAHAFTRAFYLALATGHSVESSFSIAQTAVLTAPGRTAQHARDEASKFVLMPASRNHDVKLFEGVPFSGFVEPPSMVSDVIPVVPEGFVGRQREIYAMVRSLKLHRCVSVVGGEGIGKSATAIAAANFMSERKMFRDGILFLRVQFDDTVEGLCERLLDQWFDRQLRATVQQKRSKAMAAVAATGGGRLASAESTHEAEFGMHTTAEAALLARLRTADCLIVLDKANAAAGFFVRTLQERTRSVRFLMTTRQRALADEHTVTLRELSPAAAARLLLRRCPRQNLCKDEIPEDDEKLLEAEKQEQEEEEGGGSHRRPSQALRGVVPRLQRALQRAGLLQPARILRVCSRMRNPGGLPLAEALRAEAAEC